MLRLINGYNLALGLRFLLVGLWFLNFSWEADARYKDYGNKKVEILAHEKMPIPAHPNCRCCFIPVIDDTEPIQLNLEKENDTIQKKINIVRSPKAAISPDVQEAIDKVHELQRRN